MLNRIPNPLTTRLAVAATLFLLPLLYFWPAVIGKVTLAPGDGWTQNFGIRILIGQLLSGGQLPLWNPYLFAGMPLLANIQAGALYPPNWLFAIFSPQLAINLVVITTYHIALAGTYLYARRIGLNRIGAIVAGIVFAFGGFMVAHLGHTNMIGAAAWLGWILLAIEELYLSFRWRWVSLGALFIALQFLSGAPQITLYTMLVVSGYVIFSLTLRPGKEQRARFLLGVISLAVCAVLISMVQLLPSREMLEMTERAGINYAYFGQCSLPHKQIYGMVFPFFLGGAATGPYRLPYWGMCGLTEYCGYVGLLALLLALTMAIRQLIEKSGERLVWFWIACAGAALFLALGYYMPFGIHKLLHRVPVYNLFRVSARHLFEFTFALGILAGFGVTRLSGMARITEMAEMTRKEQSQTRRALLLSITIVSLIAVAGVVTLKFFSPTLVKMLPSHAETNPFTLPEIYIPAVFFTLSVLALLMYLRHRSAIATAILITTLFLDLMSFGHFYEWRTFSPNITERLVDPPTVKLIKERERDLNGLRILSRSSDPWGVNSKLLDYPNISIVRGLQSVNGYDPLRLIRITEITGGMSPEGYVKDESAFSSDHQGFNLLNAKYLLYERTNIAGPLKVIYDAETKSPGPPVNANLPADRWRRLAQFGDVELYENLKALPRAWFVRNAAVEASADILRIIKNGKMLDGAPFDPSQTALFEKEDFEKQEIKLPAIGDPAGAEVKITQYEPNRITIRTRNQQPGFLVFSEIYYAGWEALVDGRPAPVKRVNYVLRGVEAPEGEHLIEFVFRTDPFRIGAVCTLLGFAFLLIGGFKYRRHFSVRRRS